MKANQCEEQWKAVELRKAKVKRLKKWKEKLREMDKGKLAGNLGILTEDGLIIQLIKRMKDKTFLIHKEREDEWRIAKDE